MDCVHDIVMDAANACGLVFEQHLIVAATGEYFSFRDAGLVVPVKRMGGKLAKLPKAARTGRTTSEAGPSMPRVQAGNRLR